MFKWLYRKISHISKYTKIKNKDYKSQIALCVLTMVVCCTVFCANTFAWFTAQKKSEVSTIVSANYHLSVSMDGAQLNEQRYTCLLAHEDRHIFTITANGTATIGYCEIKVGEQTYKTVSIPKGQSITLTVIASAGTEISFVPYWGIYDGTEHCYQNGDCITVSHTSYQEYIVAENVTLQQIADYYNVSAYDILTYNGISEITAGEVIKIPNTAVTEPLVILEEPVEDSTKPSDENDEEITDITESKTESTDDLGQEPTENEPTPTEPQEPVIEPTEPTTSPKPSEPENTEPVEENLNDTENKDDQL